MVNPRTVSTKGFNDLLAIIAIMAKENRIMTTLEINIACLGSSVGWSENLLHILFRAKVIKGIPNRGRYLVDGWETMTVGGLWQVVAREDFIAPLLNAWDRVTLREVADWINLSQ